MVLSNYKCMHIRIQGSWILIQGLQTYSSNVSSNRIKIQEILLILQLETDYSSKLFISEILHSKQWHYSLHRDFQNCYSTRRSLTRFFPVMSSTQGHLASYIVDDDSKNNSRSQVKIHLPQQHMVRREQFKRKKPKSMMYLTTDTNMWKSVRTSGFRKYLSTKMSKISRSCLHVMFLARFYQRHLWSFWHMSRFVSAGDARSGNVRWPRCHPAMPGVQGAMWPNTSLLLGRALLGSAYRRRSLLCSTPTLEGGQCTGARITKLMVG